MFIFNGDNICQTPISNFGTEITGFYQKDIMDFICYIVPISNRNLQIIFNIIYEKESLVFSDVPYYIKKYNQENDICCIKIHESEYDEYFYSFQYNEIKRYNDNKINILPPQILGANYQISIRKDEIIGIIPMKPDNDFNYITYYSKEIYGLYNASIIMCEEFPFCIFDSNNINKTALLYYNLTSFTYTKSEYDNNISPNSKKQNILVLTCKSESCLINSNIYTDKNNVTLAPKDSFHKYIRENTEDKLLISLKPYLEKYLNDIIHLYLNIEILSGNIGVSLIGGEYIEYKYENKILYEINADKNNEYLLKIKAQKNTFYSVTSFIENKNDKILIPQINYIIKFNELNEIFIDSSDNFAFYYISFFPLNCKIQVKKSFQYQTEIKKSKDFYQHLLNFESSDNYDVNGYIVNNINKKDLCFLRVSLFEIKNLFFNDLNSIILANGITHKLIFYKDFNIIKYLYIHTQKEKDVNINLKLYDDIIYNMSLFINDIYIISYNIKKDKIISISSNDLRKYFKYENQPCKINFIVSPQNNNKSTIEVKIVVYEKTDKISDANKKYFFVLIIIVICISALLIIIRFFKRMNFECFLKSEIIKVFFNKDDIYYNIKDNCEREKDYK